MASFFEKLTGASEKEVEAPKISSVKKTKAKTKTKKSKPKQKTKKNIKKTVLDMPKIQKQPIEDLEPETEVLEKALEEKKTDWLEEAAEGEEGQLTIDVYQTPSDIVIKSTVAGVNPEDIDISIANDMVTVKGRRMKDKEVSAENYYYQELYWGAFSRSVILPVEVDSDKAKAVIKNGILTIRLPKSEKVKAKKIKVRSLE